MKRKTWVPVVAGLALGGTAAAEVTAQVENIEDFDLEALLGTVSSVSRRTESVLKAPASVTTIPAEDLRLFGASSLPDMLRWVPGVQVFRNAAGNHVVALRGTGGLSSNNVVVMIDGTPLNSPVDASVDWAAMMVNAADVERVEIVRGPVSTIYGANAYTGVVNVITRTAGANGGHRAVRARGGTDLSGRPAGSVSGSVSHGSDGAAKWAGFGTVDFDRSFAGSNGAQPALAGAGLLGRVDLPQGERSTVSVQAGASLNRRSALDHLVLEPNSQQSATGFAAVRYELREPFARAQSVSVWGRALALDLQADPLAYRGFSYADTSAQRAEAGADLSLDLPAGFVAQVGASALMSRVDAPYLHPDINGQVRPGYGFHGGITGEVADAVALSLAGRGDLSEITGRLEFSYRASAVWFRSDSAFRFAAGSAYRSPTWVEAGGRFADPASRLILLEGQGGILSPRIDSAELGALLRPVSRLTLSPTVYVARLGNLMVEDFRPLVRKSFANDLVPRTVAGAELEAEYRSSNALSLFATVGALRFLSEGSGETATVGVPEQNSQLTAGLRGRGSWERWAFGAGALYVSPRQYDVRAGIPPRILSVQTGHSVRLEGAVDYRLPWSMPLWASLRAVTHLPGPVVESPFPNAGALGTSALLGLEYRSE